MRMLAVGLSQGPPHHYWYAALDAKLPGKTTGIIGKKILADQLVAAPFFAVTFIVFAALLEGRSLAQALTLPYQNIILVHGLVLITTPFQAWKEFTEKFPTIYLFDWIIWPPSQAVNFLIVPPQFRYCTKTALQGKKNKTENPSKDALDKTELWKVQIMQIVTRTGVTRLTRTTITAVGQTLQADQTL